MPRRAELLVLAAILLSGLVLRGLYFCEHRQHPDFRHLRVDAEFHDYWARGLATGNWLPPQRHDNPLIRSVPYLRPPGYPYFLSLIYRVAGPNWLAAYVVQIALSLFSCLLVFFFARKWFTPTVGLIAAAFMFVYWSFIYFEGKLHAAILLIALALSLVYVLSLWIEKTTFLRAAGAGALLGLVALVRPTILPFGLVVLVWLVWILRRRGALGRFPQLATGYLLGAALIIAPSTIRNYVVADQFVLISSNGGINLYIGNGEHADGRFVGRLPGLGDFDTCFDYRRIVKRLEQKTGRPLSDSDASRYFSDRAVDFVRTHPMSVASLVLKKSLLFWGPREISHNEVPHYDRRRSKILSFIPGNFALAVSMAVVGLALLLGNHRAQRHDQRVLTRHARQQQEAAVLVLLFVVVYFISFLPFFVTTLYRLPVIPFLFIFGAYGLYRVVAFIRARSIRKTTGWILVWAVLYVLAGTNLAGYEPDEAAWHYGLGVAHDLQGRTQKAIEEYRETLRINPQFNRVYNNLAIALSRRGDPDQAIAYLREGLRANPSDAELHNNLGVVLSRKGMIEQAIASYNEALRLDPHHALPYHNLANALAGQGRLDRAIALYRQALEIKPYYVDAHNNLALTLLVRGEIDQAIAHLSEALRIRPGYVEAHNNIGVALARQGKFDHAIDHYRQVLQIQPDHADAYYNLAVALSRQGKLGEAVAHYYRSLQIKPEDAVTHYDLADALLQQGKTAEAVKHLSEAVRIAPRHLGATGKLAWLLATSPGHEIRDGQEALRLARQLCQATGDRSAQALDILAAAYAETRQFDRAISAVQRAVQFAKSQGRTDLAQQFETRLQLYRSGQPCRQTTSFTKPP